MAKRGRPSVFDRDQALRQAMDLFWAQGYEGSTLEDLLAAMGGITPPSFYNAFGSKEKLFKEAADLFVATVGAPAVQALEQSATAREAIEAMLGCTAESYSQPGRPHGCLLVLGATHCASAGKGAQDYLHSLRRLAPKAVKARLQRGVAEGDLAASADLDAMAAFYAAVINGMGVRAGDGAPRRELLAVAKAAMASWPVLAGGPAKPARYGNAR